MPLRPLLLAAALLGLTACSTWKPVRERDRWTLYVRDAEEIELAVYEQSIEIAFAPVESTLGPFQERVRVHAWSGGVELSDDGPGKLLSSNDDLIHEVPGVGVAKVQAFHSRSPGMMRPAGVFVGTPETGTVVHELVHARLAEIDSGLPLWLEEGLATFIGDGALHGGRWVVDGFACWPWRELREDGMSDAELRRILSLRPGDEGDLRENVLAHFVGWAIVFDLYREGGTLDATTWVRDYRDGMDVTEAWQRLTRTLVATTAFDWLGRLDDPDPGVRIAAARGTWKVRDRQVALALAARLDVETDDEVRVALALNALASEGEVELGWVRRRKLWRLSIDALATAELDSAEETEACRELWRAYRHGVRREESRPALEKLRRFWAE